MKGTISKTESGWEVWYTKPRTDNQNGHYLTTLPLHPDNIPTQAEDHFWIDGKEVDFEILTDYDNNGPDHFPKFARIITPEEVRFNLSKAELKDWDVTLNYDTIMNFGVINDGLENEPYISDDFQIGSEGAYEHANPDIHQTKPGFVEKRMSQMLEHLANEEFKNVGDEGLFPNHTDKDIWTAGFKAGYLKK